MADNWTGSSSGVYAVNGNWEDGSHPGGGGANPTLYWFWGDVSVIGTDRSASANADSDPSELHVGGNYTGSIGDVSTPLLYDDIQTEIRINVAGPDTQVIHFGWDTCPLMVVENCGNNADAVLIDRGTLTELVVSGGQKIHLSGTASVGDVRLFLEDPSQLPPVITIESGVTITGTIYAEAGIILLRSAAVDIELAGTAVLRREGAGTGGITGKLTVIGPNAKAYLGGDASYTVNNVESRLGGLVDSTYQKKAGKKVTFTNGLVQSGGRIKVKELDTFTNPPKRYSGSIEGYTGNVSIIVGGKP